MFSHSPGGATELPITCCRKFHFTKSEGSVHMELEEKLRSKYKKKMFCKTCLHCDWAADWFKYCCYLGLCYTWLLHSHGYRHHGFVLVTLWITEFCAVQLNTIIPKILRIEQKWTNLEQVYVQVLKCLKLAVVVISYKRCSWCVAALVG